MAALSGSQTASSATQLASKSDEYPTCRRSPSFFARPLPVRPLLVSDRSRPQLPAVPNIAPPVRHWEPRCNHSTMMRIYHGAYKCDHCCRAGHFGWVYRCTVDREAIIIGEVESGVSCSLGPLGRELAKEMSLGKFGPDARAEKYSFLKEITTEQLHTYTPPQVATILSQRDNVRETIWTERQDMIVDYPGRKYPDDGRPWMPDKLFECQYKVCQHCHHLGKEKSWLSINSVLNGDILPSAATGYGFGHMGLRPEADVDVVREIGYRAVPMPRLHPSRCPLKRMSSTPTWKLMDIVDGRLETATASTSSESSISSDPSDGDLPRGEQPRRRGRLPRSPASSNLLVDTSNIGGDNESLSGDAPLQVPSLFDDEILIRPPWTPPPSPAPAHVAVPAKAAFEVAALCYEGRSPYSLKTNLDVRSQVFASILSADSSSRAEDHVGHGCRVAPPPFPYQPEEMCDVGLVLPFNQELYDCACRTPLPRSGMEERLYFANSNGEVEGCQEDGDSFTDQACDIAGGVALTEEAVESGTDDVVAHVEHPALGLLKEKGTVAAPGS